MSDEFITVVPAQAGTQTMRKLWLPASAGMTRRQ